MRSSRNLPVIQALSGALEARRLALGLTQEDLAGRIELDRPYITLKEAGRKQPTLSVLWRLAEGLQLSPGELLHLVEQQLKAS